MSKERIQIQQSIEQSQEFTKMPKAFVSILNGANPSVADVSILKCSGDTVTVTDFKDGQEGQRIHIRGDGLTTIQDNANIITNTGLDKLLASGQIYSFTAFYDEVLKIITWVEDECCGGEGEEVDLSDFYTKAEVDSLIAGVDAPVASVFGRTGAVVAAAGDYDAFYYTKAIIDAALLGFSVVGHSHSFASLTSKPTTIAGYGITDFNSLGDARWSLLAHVHTFASLTSKPTTLAGYGITDTLFTQADADLLYAALVHTHSFASLTSKPTDIAGYGITDFNSLGDARWSLLAHSHTFASLTSKPTTIAGFGITDFNSLGDARWSLLAHSHTFASLTSKPTDIAGYGITDAYTKVQVDALVAAGGIVSSVFGRTGAVVAAANDYTFAQLASKPTTIAGYGITDFNSLGDARWSLLAHVHTFASLTGKPTDIAGYGITDFNSLGDARWSLLAHTHTFASLTSKPTTIAGYGITDFNSLGDARWSLLAHVHAFSALTGIPTTIAGYGITDFNSLGDARWSLLAHTHTFASLTSKPTDIAGYGITDFNSLGDARWLKLAGGTLTGALLFSTDNTIDIGASGATRPRTLYLGTEAKIGATRYLSTAIALDNDNSWLRLLGGSNDAVANGAFGLFTGVGYTAALRGVVQLVAGNPGTPTGADGQILFYTGATALRWAINRAGDLVAGNDNVYDIGAVGATRPRRIYVGTDLRIGDAGTFAEAYFEIGSQSSAAAAFVDFHADGLATDYNTRMIRASGANGMFQIDQLGTGGIRLAIAGTDQFVLVAASLTVINQLILSAAAPALRVNNTVANALVAVTLGSTGPTGSTAGAPRGWLPISVAGTTRYIPFW